MDEVAMSSRYVFLILFFLPLSVFATDAGVENSPAPTQSVSYQVTAGGGIELIDASSGVTFQTQGPDIVFAHASGEPNLPSVWVTLLLPENADLTTVTPRISNLETATVSVHYNVAPVPLQRITVLTESDGGTIANEEVIVPDGVDENTGENTVIYGASSFWPEDWISYHETLMEESFPLVRVLVNLARVNPNPAEETSDGSEIEQLHFGILHVDFEVFDDDDDPVDGEAPSTPTEWLIYNVDNGQNLGAPSNDGLDGYLIVTTSDIYSDATAESTVAKNAIDDFKAHKEARGYNVVIQTETEWLTVPERGGQDAAGDLRDWLSANHEIENWKYVLLIGNPVGDSYMPMKEVWPSNTGHQWWAELPAYSGFYMHTDYFYAELSGNWDMDGDGKAGEFGHYSTPIPPYTKTGDFGTAPDGETGIDRDHEVIVGRIPFYPGVSSKFEDLAGILNKTIDYQSAFDTEIDWRKNVLLMAQHPAQYFFGEQIRDQVLSQDPEIDSYRVYNADCLTPTDTCSPVITEPNDHLDDVCNNNTVTSRWAQETPGVVTWFSHGSPTGAAGVFHVNNIPSLDTPSSEVTQDINDTPAFTFQASCLTGKPDHNNNLAYSLLKKGGIATLGATQVSYGPFSPVPMANSAAITGLAYEYIKSLVIERMPAGDALFDVKKRVPIQNHFWHYWVNLTLFNLYGDPEVGLYDHQTQYNFYVAPLSNQQLEVNENFSLAFQIATDAPSYDVAFSQKPDWLSFDNQTLILSGTPSEADVGQHTVSVLVGSDADSVHQSFVLSVERSNQPPRYEGELEIYIPLTDEPYRFRLPVIDPERDRVDIRYDYSRPPDWIDMVVASGDDSNVASIENVREGFELVFYLSGEVVGSHEVRLVVSDGRAEVEFVLLVHVCGTDSDNDICHGMFDACVNAPCLNGGTCVSTLDNGRSCVCVDGFEGVNCETALEAADAGVHTTDAGVGIGEEDAGTTTSIDAGSLVAFDAGMTIAPESDGGVNSVPMVDAGMISMPVLDAGSLSEIMDSGNSTEITTVDAGDEDVDPGDNNKDDEADKEDTEVDDAGCGCNSQNNNKSSVSVMFVLALLGLRRRRW
jgi:hypothetical protein